MSSKIIDNLSLDEGIKNAEIVRCGKKQITVERDKDGVRLYPWKRLSSKDDAISHSIKKAKKKSSKSHRDEKEITIISGTTEIKINYFGLKRAKVTIGDQVIHFTRDSNIINHIPEDITETTNELKEESKIEYVEDEKPKVMQAIYFTRKSNIVNINQEKTFNPIKEENEELKVKNDKRILCVRNINITECIKKLANKNVITKTLTGVVLASCLAVVGIKVKQKIDDYEEAKYQFQHSVSITCYYRVKGGDTLWDIAHNHGIDISDIEGVNGRIYPDAILNIGEELVYTYYVPEEKIKYATIEVERDMFEEDDLDKIANKCCTNGDTLRRLNQYNTDSNIVLIPNFKSIYEIEEEYNQDMVNHSYKKM